MDQQKIVELLRGNISGDFEREFQSIANTIHEGYKTEEATAEEMSIIIDTAATIGKDDSSMEIAISLKDNLKGKKL